MAVHKWHVGQQCDLVSKMTYYVSSGTLTLSLPIPLRFYTLPYMSNPPFLIHSGALALRTGRQSARMSKIKNSGLDQYGAEPLKQQQFGTVGVEGVKHSLTPAVWLEIVVNMTNEFSALLSVSCCFSFDVHFHPVFRFINPFYSMSSTSCTYHNCNYWILSQCQTNNKIR